MRGQRGCRGGVTTTHMQDSSARSATIPARLIVISVPASQLMVRSSPICTEEKGKSCVSLRHGVVVDHPRFVAFGPRTGTAGETMVRTTVRREKLSEVGTMVRQATPARGVAERSRAGPVVPRDTQRASTGTRIDTGYASSIVKNASVWCVRPWIGVEVSQGGRAGRGRSMWQRVTHRHSTRRVCRAPRPGRRWMWWAGHIARSSCGERSQVGVEARPRHRGTPLLHLALPRRRLRGCKRGFGSSGAACSGNIVRNSLPWRPDT